MSLKYEPASESLIRTRQCACQYKYGCDWVYTGHDWVMYREGQIPHAGVEDHPAPNRLTPLPTVTEALFPPLSFSPCHTWYFEKTTFRFVVLNECAFLNETHLLVLSTTAVGTIH